VHLPSAWHIRSNGMVSIIYNYSKNFENPTLQLKYKDYLNKTLSTIKYKVFIIIAQPAGTTIKLLSPIPNWVNKAAACQAIMLRLLMSKQMQAPVLPHRHHRTH